MWIYIYPLEIIRTAWKNTLTTVLNSNSPHLWTYVVNYPSTVTTNTGKLAFTVSGNGGIQPQFTFAEHLYEQFGFDAGTYSFVGNVKSTTIECHIYSLWCVQ